LTVPTPLAAAGRVALAHDWLTGMRGGEKVLDAICELFPDAPVYTLVHAPGSVSARIESRRVRTSFVQKFPAAVRFYRQYLPFFPAAVELFDLDRFDLVVSTSHCAVKSVVRPGRAVHVTYCHSPMRYAWDQFDAYFGVRQVGRLRHRVLRPVLAAMARWDRDTAGRVDQYVANSHYVAGRIRRYYNRGSTVVYPPVDTAFYRPPDDRRQPRSGFLVVSALVPYKRLEVAIDACRLARVPLSIVGTGPEHARLQAAAGPDVTFLGWRSDEEIRELYRQSTATLLPGVEDFGMVPVEAQACGCPVIALGEGGAAETVVHGETGVLVEELSAEAFAHAIERTRDTAFDPDRLEQHARRFSKERFLTDFQAVVTDALAARHRAGGRRPVHPGPRVDVASRTSPSAAREDDRGDAASRTQALPPAAREDDRSAASCTPSSPSAAREDEQ
jgi:glycosyltransferase involved in cell wall biosynthesis